jgi:hypothetical protein
LFTLSPPASLPPHCTYLQSCLSLLISKSMFRGVCPLWLYFDSFNPFHCSPLPFMSHPPIFQQLSVHILISFTTVTFYDTVDTLAFSFPFPEFHRVVPLLQSCSASEFVCDHACSCVCLSLDLSSTYERKHASFVFLILANFT